MRPLFWQQIVISSSCTNNMPFWCWPRSWAYYTVWLWAMLLMFHRYKLTPVSWSKCVRLLNFSVYNMYVEVWKRWGGGDDKRVGVGASSAPRGTVNQESCATNTFKGYRVQQKITGNLCSQAITKPSTHPPHKTLKHNPLYIHRNSLTLRTSTMKMEAVYTSKHQQHAHVDMV